MVGCACVTCGWQRGFACGRVCAKRTRVCVVRTVCGVCAWVCARRTEDEQLDGNWYGILLLWRIQATAGASVGGVTGGRGCSALRRNTR